MSVLEKSPECEQGKHLNCTDEVLGDDGWVPCPCYCKQPPYGPGAICEWCGHFAARHDKNGCTGVVPTRGCQTTPDGKQCPVFLWGQRKYPEPWKAETIS